MSGNQPTNAEVNRSYHPHGFDSSASLKRARNQFRTRNLLTGGAIVAFIVGTYLYSISAVKQDDFSDVVDLLPPEAERKNIRTIEDEARDRDLGEAPDRLLAAAPATASPLPSSSTASTPSSVVSLLPRRLSELEWVKSRGWVEDGKDNVLVWGAPNVDNIGKIHDNTNSRGRRMV